MIVCCCDGSVNGIFTAIYRAWEIGTSKTAVSVSGCEDMELFSEYRYFESDEAVAAKVADTIKSKLSAEIYSQIYSAALSCASDRGNIIYRFLIDAFRTGPGIVDHLANPYVMRIFQLDRNVTHEAHQFTGFLRFGKHEDNSGSFYIARFDPMNNVLDLVSNHFADRMLNDNWIIADTKRNICSLHKTGSRHYIITDISDDALNKLIESTRENTAADTHTPPSRTCPPYSNETIEELWEIFRTSVAVKPRLNEKLQQQLMPLRYRTYMNTYTEPKQPEN